MGLAYHSCSVLAKPIPRRGMTNAQANDRWFAGALQKVLHSVVVLQTLRLHVSFVPLDVVYDVVGRMHYVKASEE